MPLLPRFLFSWTYRSILRDDLDKHLLVNVSHHSSPKLWQRCLTSSLRRLIVSASLSARISLSFLVIRLDLRSIATLCGCFVRTKCSAVVVYFIRNTPYEIHGDDSRWFQHGGQYPTASQQSRQVVSYNVLPVHTPGILTA